MLTGFRFIKEWDRIMSKFVYSAAQKYMMVETYCKEKSVHRIYFKDISEKDALILYNDLTLHDILELITFEIEYL